MGCGGSNIKKLPPKDDESARRISTVFRLTVQKRSSRQSLGLAVTEEVDGSLRVNAISRRGLVADLMAATAGDAAQHIRVGYKIVAVNDVSGDCAAMKQEMEEKVVVLSVQRRTALSTGRKIVGSFESEPADAPPIPEYNATPAGVLTMTEFMKAAAPSTGEVSRIASTPSAGASELSPEDEDWLDEMEDVPPIVDSCLLEFPEASSWKMGTVKKNGLAGFDVELTPSRRKGDGSAGLLQRPSVEPVDM
eukprot:TRINITY_DN25360_c0_g1_i1.p1 TRINITY_DN25360_c0_g1~~TRINITY_DN25360_c0_g1_i1.p1  ORF type:complete len:280 (-),score=52.60 TRINITY_DN25360_c0_g1_i1:347-1093(-)